MLQDLSSEVTSILTGEATLVEFRRIVIDVVDGDMHLRCGAGKHSVDVLLGLSSLGSNKLL